MSTAPAMLQVPAMNTYSQLTGVFTPALGLAVTGYSGHGTGKNNPSMQGVKREGPIPLGKWRARKVFDPHPHLGDYAVWLEPDAETRSRVLQMNRNPDSFFCHGDNRTHPGEASDGCMILPLRERMFIWERAPWIEVVE